MKRSFIVQAWVIWLVSMAAITLVTRNPFYLLILLLIARIVDSVCGNVEAGVKIHFWRLALIILTFSILFNLLMVSVGQTVLFRLPLNWWLIGGPKTLEAVIYGAVNGLMLITLLAIFFAFNTAVPVSDLVRLTPRAMANVGLIILLAVTYVPETISQLQRIRDAQAIRGHRLRGFQDWQPIIIPLLIGGLERSMGIAESMVSRGYGSTSNKRLPARIQFGMLAGLFLSFLGWVLTFSSGPIGWFFLLSGIVLVAGLIVWSGRAASHTRYRPRPWQFRDWLMIAFSLFSLILAFVSIPIIDQSSLFYTPYPAITLPSFDILIGFGLVLLAAPAVLIDI